MDLHVSPEDTGFDPRMLAPSLGGDEREQAPPLLGLGGGREARTGAAAGVGRQRELRHQQQAGLAGRLLRQLGERPVHPARLVGKHPKGQQPRQQPAGLLFAVAALRADQHQQAAAEQALASFEARFREGAIPEDLPEVSLSGAPLAIAQVLKQAGLAPSTSEAMRNLEQGGVRVDGARVEDKALKLAAGTYVVQVGKRRFARITLA